MSAQICPVCGGKGLVPNGFYDVGSTNLGGTHKTTSATPGTCRSCGGRGYIIEFPDSYSPSVHDQFKSCSVCNRNDGVCYTSNPPKYKCTLDGMFHTAAHSCDNFDVKDTLSNITTNASPNADCYSATQLYIDIVNAAPTSDNTIKVENKESTETNSCDKERFGCFTCANNDHRVYVSIDDDCTYTDKYRCTLDDKQYSRHHYCSEYKYDHTGDCFESEM